MINIINGLHKSINEKNWYSALFILVAIPDICAKSEFPENNNVGNRYRDWITNNFHKVNSYYIDHLCENDFYALRCSILHEGNTKIEGQKASKRVQHIDLLADGSHLITIANTIVGSNLDGKRILYMSVKELALDMIKAYHYWYENVKDKPSVLEAYSNEISITDEKTLGNNAIRIT